eukprot:1148881-Pelagomonas_calceolata.AAC.15
MGTASGSVVAENVSQIIQKIDCTAGTTFGQQGNPTLCAFCIMNLLQLSCPRRQLDQTFLVTWAPIAAKAPRKKSLHWATAWLSQRAIRKA